MQRIEVNVITKEKKVVQLSEAEVLEAKRRTLEEEVERNRQRNRSVQEKLAALGLTVEDIKAAVKA